MNKESVFGADLGFDNAIELLQRGRDLSAEISGINKANTDSTAKQNKALNELNDALAEQRRLMAGMSLDFATDLKAMQVGGLSEDDIQLVKSRYENELDIAKLVESSLLNQRRSLGDDFKIKKQQEEELYGWRLHLFKKSITTYRQLIKQTSKLSLDETLFDIGRFTINAIPSIAKTAIGLATAGAIGGLAFGGLAYSAGDERKRAMTLNSTTAEMQATRNVYNSVFSNPEGMLGQVYGWQRNPDANLSLTRLLNLINVGNNNPLAVSKMNQFDIVAQLPLAIKTAINETKKTGSPYLESSLRYAYGLGNISQEDISLIDATPQKEIDKLPEKLQAEKGNLYLADETSKQWQALGKELGLSGQKIENTALKSLEKLSPELSKLSSSITRLIESFGKSKLVADGIDKFSIALNKVSGYLENPKTLDTFSGFLNSIDEMAGVIFSITEKIGVFGEKTGWLDEQTLKGSEYQLIKKVKGINPEFASSLQEAEENPSSFTDRTKAIYDFNQLPSEQYEKIKALLGDKFSDIIQGVVNNTFTGKMARMGGFNSETALRAAMQTAGEFAAESHSNAMNYFAGKSNAELEKELNAKKGAFKGGHTTPETLNAMNLTKGIPYFNRFTAADDANDAHAKNGGHPKGAAFDFTLKDPSQSRNTETLLKKLFPDGRILNEYLHPSKKSTAPHMHVEPYKNKKPDKIKVDLTVTPGYGFDINHSATRW